jgi:hypothetical protein
VTEAGHNKYAPPQSAKHVVACLTLSNFLKVEHNINIANSVVHLLCVHLNFEIVSHY